MEDHERIVGYGKAIKGSVTKIIGAMVVLALLWNCFTIIPASHYGIIVTFGSVSERVLGEGIHFVNPLAEIKKVTGELQTVFSQGVDAASKDLQTVKTNITVNYLIEADYARNVYVQNPNLNYERQYITPAIAETLKSVISKYTAEELVTRRIEVSEGVTNSLREKLAQYHLSVRDINTTDFQFSRAFDEAIEAKVTATQQAAKAERDLERIKFEAEQRIVAAKAEAEAIKIQTQAINTAGGANYVALKGIEKWNGVMPTYIGGNAPVPFIQVGK